MDVFCRPIRCSLTGVRRVVFIRLNGLRYAAIRHAAAVARHKGSVGNCYRGQFGARALPLDYGREVDD
jgi:hypothetical protein